MDGTRISISLARSLLTKLRSRMQRSSHLSLLAMLALGTSPSTASRLWRMLTRSSPSSGKERPDGVGPVGKRTRPCYRLRVKLTQDIIIET